MVPDQTVIQPGMCSQNVKLVDQSLGPELSAFLSDQLFYNQFGLYKEMSQGNTLYSYLKQKYLFFFFFFLNREQEGKTSPVWGAGTSGREEDIRKGYEGEYGRNIMYICMKMKK
jgi:hypothetical protein